MCLSEHVVVMSISLAVKLLGHSTCICSTLVDSAKQFAKVIVSFTLLTSGASAVPHPPHTQIAL